MSLIVPSTGPIENEFGDKSPSTRSTLSSITFRTNSKSYRSPSINRSVRLQAGPSLLDISNLSDDDSDFDDSVSLREHLRSAPKIIRKRHSKSNSFHYSSLDTQQQNDQQRNRSLTVSKNPDLLVIQAPPPGSLPIVPKSNTTKDNSHMSTMDIYNRSIPIVSSRELRGQTLLHLSARLGHDEIMRLLISETSQASTLMNRKGQTPLLTAIESGATSTAILLMESDPRSIIAADNDGSSVFHYACQHCNDVVLYRAIVLSKRLNSTRDRITVR